MRHYTAKRNGITLATCLFFLLFVFGYEFSSLRSEMKRIEQHAMVISDDVWNVNLRSTEQYLKISAATGGYDRLTVYDGSGEIFHAASGNPPSHLESLFRTLRLSQEVFLYAPVRYNDREIGTIEASYYPQTATIAIRVLLFLILVCTILHMFLRSLYDRSLLEERIKSRTEELAQSNRILLREIHQKKKTASTLRKSEEEYRKLYQEAKSAEQLYRSLIDSSADAILICTLEAEIDDASSACTTLFGFTLDELKGKPFNLFTEQDNQVAQRIFSDIKTNGTSYQGYELKATTQSGKVIDISLSGSRFNNHRGVPAGMLFVIRDISSQKKMEGQLQRMERMEAVGTLAGGIAHDFNNLLMGIQGNASLALLEAKKGSDLYTKLGAIEHYIQSGQDLTSRLLGFARGGKYEVRPTDLNRICQDELHLYARTRKELTLNESYQEELWPVEIDQGQIRQVLLNLFVNAGQAMAQGGTLDLATENTALDQSAAMLFELPAGQYVRLIIRDTGHGMEQQTMARIFDPFFTTKEIGRGTGLGLASAYGIIKNHSGHIDVSSTPGAGTTFTIYLPATDKSVEEKEATIETETTQPADATILLVEDEELVRDVAYQMLTAIGYRVVSTSSGDEACKIYQENPHQFDAVLLDMIMPDMDGGAVFSSLQRINPQVKVLLSSGYAMNEQAQQIMNQGCSGFLQKPFNVQKLAEKLNQILVEN